MTLYGSVVNANNFSISKLLDNTVLVAEGAGLFGAAQCFVLRVEI